MSLHLSLIIPVLNEHKNILAVVHGAIASLTDHSFEIIVVDDSEDDLTELALAPLLESKPRVLLIRRYRKKGLASAVLEGIHAAKGEYIGVMDGDGQHVVEDLTKLVKLSNDGADIVIGSRFAGPSIDSELRRLRFDLSRLAIRVINLMMHSRLTDPLSGYFLIRRTLVVSQLSKVQIAGFKILFDFLFSLRNQKVDVRETPISFNARLEGKSKMSPRIAFIFLADLVSKFLRNRVSPEFVGFLFVGAITAGIHFGILFLCLGALDLGFGSSQLFASLSAILANYALNNSLTFSSDKNKGLGWLAGLLKYYLLSSLGILANVSAAVAIFTLSEGNSLLSSLSGIIVDTTWRYFVSRTIIWRTQN